MAATEQPRRVPARRAAELPSPRERIVVVVIGASAGGLEALTRVIGRLPASFEPAIFVVLHIAPTGASALGSILNRAGPLPVAEAAEGERILPGHVYAAPPNRHVELERDAMHLTAGRPEHGHRPAIDPLFRSAARAYGRRVAGVILSGALDDGTGGAAEIHEHGGVVIVQDPATALYPGMPRSVVRRIEVDAVIPLEEIPPALLKLAGSPLPAERAAEAQPVRPSRFSCPDCGGPLWEHPEGRVSSFRCGTGHEHTTESLFARGASELETALWAAVRLLEDRAVLLRRMAQRLGSEQGDAARLERHAREATERIAMLRTALEEGAAAPYASSDDIASP